MPTLEIIDLNDDGRGVARLNDMVYFVENALPGEIVEADIVSKKRKFALAVCRELVEPSPDRTEPVCPHFQQCGGCALGTLRYEAQLHFKTHMLRQKLERIGGLSPLEFDIDPIMGMEHPYYFRNKASFPIGGTPSDPIIGLYARGTHNVVPIERCPIQHPVTVLIVPVIRRYITAHGLSIYNERTGRGLMRHLVMRVSYATGQVMVILVTNGAALPESEHLARELQEVIDGFDPKPLEHPPCRLESLYQNIQDIRNNVILGPECLLLWGEPTITENILGQPYRISPLSFFQTNPRQTEPLFQEVLGATALTDDQTVLDLYCGAGAISLHLARRAGHVIGVDVVSEAIRDAEYAAERAGLDAIARFIPAVAEDWYPAYREAGGPCHLVILDPPRKGCDEALIQALSDNPPPRIIYVSCDPGTLARDLGMLKHQYRICKVQPVDMFPWTTHLETVVLLARLSDPPKTRMERLWEQWERVFDDS